MEIIKKIDHFVITTANPKACISFYEKLGFTAKDAGGRYELLSGDFKINVHILGKELSPHAQNICPGSADICFEISGDLSETQKNLQENGIVVELGISPKHGVRGKMQSIYMRDPDKNLIELCSYMNEK